MSDPTGPQPYRPGDVVNGWRLTEDLQWVPAEAVAPTTVEQESTTSNENVNVEPVAQASSNPSELTQQSQTGPAQTQPDLLSQPQVDPLAQPDAQTPPVAPMPFTDAQPYATQEAMQYPGMQQQPSPNAQQPYMGAQQQPYPGQAAYLGGQQYPGMPQYSGGQQQPYPGQSAYPGGSGGGEQTPNTDGKPFYKKWWFFVVAAAIVIAIITGIAVAATGGSDDSKDQVTPKPAQINGQSTKPRSGERSSKPPSRAARDDFETFSRSGSGDSTIDVPDNIHNGIITFDFRANESYGMGKVSGRDESGGSTLLLMMTIGTEKAQDVLTDSALLKKTTKLEIEAEGDWTISIEPFSAAPEMKLPLSGEGDAIYLYNGGPATWKLKNPGKDMVTVMTYPLDETQVPDLIYEGLDSPEITRKVSAGPMIVKIASSTKWTIEEVK